MGQFFKAYGYAYGMCVRQPVYRHFSDERCYVVPYSYKHSTFSEDTSLVPTNKLLFCCKLHSCMPSNFAGNRISVNVFRDYDAKI